MLKKFLASAATAVLALGLALGAASPASAYSADSPPTGEDANHEQNWQWQTGEVCVKDDKSRTVPNYTVPALPAGTVYTKIILKAGSVKGDPNTVFISPTPGQVLTTSSNKNISHLITCTITAIPDDTVTCTAATVYTGVALTNGDHINMNGTQDGVPFSTSAYIDIAQAFPQDPITESGLVVRITPPSGPQVTLPITNAQKASGVFTFTYSNYLTGAYTVTWVQFDSHNLHFTGTLECGEDLPNAAASVTVTPPSCDAAGYLTLNPTTFADWGPYTPAAGAYSVVATAKPGHTFPADNTPGQVITNGGKTKTFTGTLGDQINPNSEECGDLATPAAPDLVLVDECGEYGQVTPVTREGVKYVVTFNSTTGVYSVVATPKDDYYFVDDQDGVDDQTITYSGTVGAYYICESEPNASAAYGECVYDDEAAADDRTATITYDNEASNEPVAFSGIPGHDQVVPANTKVTFDIEVGPEGANYTVIADGKSFPITIDPCAEYIKPKDDKDSKTTEKLECGSLVEITTINSTVTYVFNKKTLTWDAQPIQYSDPVITTRPMTSEEKIENCGFTIDTDPRASECGVDDEGTELSTWIYVDTDPRAIYTIKNNVTDVTIIGSGYVSVPAGAYTVTAEAAPGYVLNPSAPKTWPTYFVEDTTKCENPDLATVTPIYSMTPMTCTAVGSYTLSALDPGTVDWSVNNGPFTSGGTFTVGTTQEISLVAKPHVETDGLDPDWAFNDTNNILVLKFAAPATACDFPTLALTGAGFSGQLILVGILFTFGGLGLMIARRRILAGH